MKRKTYRVQKPWGTFEQFTLNEQSTVKILMVKAHARLSYQSHAHREEFWRCITGPVKVVIDDRAHILRKNQEIYIPQGSKHRLVGMETDGEVLEISFGTFDELDIVRYEDDFGRTGTTAL